MGIRKEIQELPKRESLPHEPDCCCEFNPSTDTIQPIVLASNCCSVHNINPIPCQAVPCCKGREADYEEDSLR